MSRNIKSLKTRFVNLTVVSTFALTSIGSALPLLVPGHAFADSAIDITNVAQLRDAIEHQADGQTWNIGPGTYGLTAFNDITAGCPSSCQTGWYFPVTANDITINGIGNPTIYGTGYSTNGSWATQDFVSVFGNNVSINGVTLMPKIEPNKTVEVLGSNFSLTNSTITKNTLADQSEYGNIPNAQDQSDERQWGGSIYYNNATGTQTLSNVTINNGGVSVHAPTATFNVSNVHFDYTSDVDWIDDYRFYIATPSAVINGTPTYTYHVSSEAGLDNALYGVNDTTTVGTDTILLDSNITATKQITISKDNLTFDGQNHTISPQFTKTDNSNNSVLGIMANDVTVQNLVVDGAGGTNLHGINFYQANNGTLWRVTSKDNDHDGIVVNDSKVVATDISTSGNGWGGVDVDKGAPWLKVAGINHYNENPGVPDIYFDSWSPSKVLFATGDQFDFRDNYLQSGDRAYFQAPSIPSVTLADSNNHNVSDNGYITTQHFTFTLTNPSADGVTHYQLKYWNNISGSPFNGQSNAWNPHTLGGYTTNPADLSKYVDQFTQGEGTHYFAFSACDAAGICSAYGAPFTVTYDHTAPTGSATYTGGVDVGGVRYLQSINDFKYSATLGDNIALDQTSFVVFKLDSNGHRISGQFCGNWHNSSTTETLSGTTSDSVTNIPINKCTWYQGNGSWTDGSYEIAHIVYDKAGNTGHFNTPTQKFVIDGSTPVVTDDFTRTMLTGDKDTLAPTVSGETGPVTYAWTVSDSHLLNDPHESLTGSTLDIGPAPKGDYTATLTVTDQAGNATTKTYAVTISTHASVNNKSNKNTVQSQQQVLGASIDNSSSQNGNGGGNGSNNGNANDNSNSNGQVKGDSTTQPNTVNFANTGNTQKTKTSNAFLGLGWWWLAILAALAIFWALFAGRRDTNTDEN